MVNENGRVVSLSNPGKRVLLLVRVRLARQVDRLLVVDVIEDLAEIPHVDERTADRAVGEVVDLQPAWILLVDAGVSREVIGTDCLREAPGKIRRNSLVRWIADLAG
jgi:hypothetical protein